MKPPEISVIVPAYNTPDSVFEECCRSISGQTMDSFEVIVVDDASDDANARAIEGICDSHGFRYLRNEFNVGVSGSRNRGIDEATGEYLAFVDSDDCVYPDFFEEAKDLAERTGADCVMGGLVQTSPDAYLPARGFEGAQTRVFNRDGIVHVMRGTLAGRDFMPKSVVSNGSFVHAGPCGRLYRRSTVGDLRFDESLSMGEDIWFNLEFLDRAESCVVVDRTWYQYKRHPASATSFSGSDAVKAQVEFCERLRCDKLIETQELTQEAYGRILASLKVVVGRGIARSSKDWLSRLNEIKATLSLPVFAEALEGIETGEFDLSPKDKAFLALARADKCRALLLMFECNSFIEATARAVRSGARRKAQFDGTAKDRRIAIATMVGQNHGNRLQNYALQLTLERMSGATVETLRTCYGASPANRLAKSVLRHVLPDKRWARFASFDAQYVRYSHHRMDERELGSSRYDFFVIGSDQVWNPTFDITGDAEYLPQVAKERKASYAASFGVDEIREGRDRMARLIDGVGSISVREASGQAIVKELTGRQAELVLDPTLLLSDEDWLAVAHKPNMEVEPNGYILRYALGEDVPDGGATNGSGPALPVVNLKDRSLPVGPAEFVWLIANAACVVTDSYHAVALSIVFHTPFVVYRRKSQGADMSSRFDTLCDMLGLPKPQVTANTRLLLTSPDDWDEVDLHLKSLRQQSFSYLEGVLRNAGLV